MAGVTDRSFRRICREWGAEYTVSEMVSAKALCYEQKSRRAEASQTAALAAVDADELPFAVQLFGREADYMAEAARMIESCAYRGCMSDAPPTAIDINMGCPVRKVTGNGEGSALMREPETAAQIVRAVSRAVSIPVTVKIRAGWDRESVCAPEFAKRMEDAGASLICVHARTREQLYAPGIDLSIIENTKRSVSVPVIGNGDVFTVEDALRMREQTGCDGVMVARGALGNPWLFAQIRQAMDGETPMEVAARMRIEMALRHLADMIDHKGERVGSAEAKKQIAWYLKGMNGAAAARAAVMTAGGSEEIRSVLCALNAEQEEI